METTKPQLIVGLGNPGLEYVNTRHNIGFMVVEALAERLGWSFKEDKKLFGRVAKGSYKGQSTLLLLPQTYMNESGKAVRKVLDFFKLSPQGVVTVLDDIAIPFGEMRLKDRGGAGGHNGLKSIERHLGTSQTIRLRMGIGDREHGSLSSHVLGRFSTKEAEALDPFIQRGLDVLCKLLDGASVASLMNEANKRMKAPTNSGVGETKQ